MHNPTRATTSRDITFIEGSDKILNSTRKTTDFMTILYIGVVNIYIKVLVGRIFSILVVISGIMC